MKKVFSLLALASLSAGSLFAAQTEVELQNPNFDEGEFTWKKTDEGKTVDGAYDVQGWTITKDGEWVAIGTFEYGCKMNLRGDGILPDAPEGVTGGALACSAAWGGTVKASQKVTLDQGYYLLMVDACNVIDALQGDNLLGWAPEGGDAVIYGDCHAGLLGWHTDALYFTVGAETEGDIQVGFKAANSGGTANADIVYDSVKLIKYDNEEEAQAALKEVKYTRNYSQVLLNSKIATYLESCTEATAKAIAAAEVLVNFDATSLTTDQEFQAKETEVVNAVRTLVYSNMLAEGLGHAVKVTDLITNPDASAESATTGWVLAQGDGGASIGYNQGEGFTLPDGTTFNKYFDGGNWNGSDWTTRFEQTIQVPAGKYRLSVLSRAATNLRWFRLKAADVTADMPHTGGEGGVFGRGWNGNFVDFEVAEEGGVVIGIEANTQTLHEWQGFVNFNLVRLVTPVPADVEKFYLHATTEQGGGWTHGLVEMVKGEDGTYTVDCDLVEPYEYFISTYNGYSVAEAQGMPARVPGELNLTDHTVLHSDADGNLVHKPAGVEMTLADVKPMKADTTEDGNKTFTLDLSNAQPSVEVADNGDLTGIEAVKAAQDAPVEYFNLQGIRVENPSNGIFIRRQGNTATKVAF